MIDKLTKNQQEQLEDQLFSSDDNVYAVVDSALSHEIHLMVQGGVLEYRCLYEGQEAELLEEAAPYLLELKQSDELTNWLFETVYMKNAISFIQSPEEIEALANHLRQYAKIQTSIRGADGEIANQWVFFAFYDPRVFPRFVKGNNPEQNAEFFDGINHFFCENSEDKNLLIDYIFNEKEQKTNKKAIHLDEAVQRISKLKKIQEEK